MRACTSNQNKPLEKNEYKNGLQCDKDCHKLAIEIQKREYRIKDLSSPCNKWRILRWQKHRRRIENMKPIVDTKTPRISPVVFTRNNFVYNQRLRKFCHIETQNTMLTKHIEEIFKGKGQIDDQLSPSTKCNNNGFRVRLNEELKKVADNILIAKRLDQVKSTMSRKEHLSWYAYQEDKMEALAKYPLYWRSRICRPYEKFAMMNAASGSKPVVYFDFEVKDIEVGRVIIELNTAAAPVAVENFRALCNGSGKSSFHCCRLDKIWPGVYYKAGRGASGAVSSPFPPKSQRMKHNAAGIVTLVNNGDDMFDAEFMITERELAPLDSTNLVIGRVIEGMEFLQGCVKYLTRNSMSTTVPIYIIKTGEIDPNGPPPESPRKIEGEPPRKPSQSAEEEAFVQEKQNEGKEQEEERKEDEYEDEVEEEEEEEEKENEKQKQKEAKKEKEQKTNEEKPEDSARIKTSTTSRTEDIQDIAIGEKKLSEIILEEDFTRD